MAAHKFRLQMLFILLCLLFFLLTAHNISIGFLPEYSNRNIAVRFEYYGAFEKEIEELVSRLEEKYMELKGIEAVFSMSEVGKGYILCKFSDRADLDDAYLQVSDATSYIYSDFPSNVNRPEIIKSGLDDFPVFIASFKKSSTFDPEKVKKLYASLPDAGDVEIGGKIKKELLIQADLEKLSLMGLSLNDLNSTIWQNNLIGNADLSEGQRLVLDARCLSPENFDNLWISDRCQLKNIATVEHRLAEQDNVAHLDGEETFLVYVKKSGDGNAVRLCRGLKRLSKDTGAKIVLNRGGQIEKAVIMAGAISGIGLFLILSIELAFSAITALFAVSILGFQTDVTVILSLVMVCIFLRLNRILSGKFKYLFFSLMVFIPILFASQRIKTLFTPFSIAFCSGIAANILFRFFFDKIFASGPAASGQKNALAKVISVSVILVITLGVQICCFANPSDVSFSMEFETGTSFGYVEKIAAEVENALLGWKNPAGVTMHLENERANFEIAGVTKSALKKKMDEFSSSYPNIFFYFPEKYQKKGHEVVVYGDDLAAVRKSIQNLVENIHSVRSDAEIVYNFKSDRTGAIFEITSESAMKGIEPYTVCRTLYNASAAPVVDKFFLNATETDIKTCCLWDSRKSLDKLLAIPILGSSGNKVSAGEFIRVQYESAPSKIYHRNRMREYTFTVIGLDKKKLEKLLSCFEFTGSCHAEVCR